MIEYKIEHETEVEFFVGTPSVSSSSESLEFLVVVHYVTSDISCFSGFFGVLFWVFSDLCQS